MCGQYCVDIRCQMTLRKSKSCIFIWMDGLSRDMITSTRITFRHVKRLADGTIPQHQRWAGGPQSYLCATQAPAYVKRNFSEIKKNGISLDGAYLDVFACNEGDECDNPEHRMTRRECYEFRGKCFEYLLSNGILSSSEEECRLVPYGT